MYPQQLRQLLADGGITPGNVGQLASVSDAWFTAEPGPTSLVLRCIFRELYGDWDEQGVPYEKYEPFERLLLPVVTETVEAVLLSEPARLAAALNGLAVAFRDCCR